MLTKYETVHNLKKVKLVIGNGFDLHCNLKSSYKDFFEYNKQKNDKIKNWIEGFKNKAADYCSYKISNYDSFWLELDKIDEINSWDVFFCLKSNMYNSWCDVEKEMLNSLKNEISIIDISLLWENVYKILSGKEPPAVIDICVLCGFVMKKTGHKILSKDEFYSFLLSELKKFENNFGNYIKFQLPYSNPFGVITNRDYLILSNYTIDSLCDKNSIVSISSFNYGNVIDKSLKEKFRNINGNVDSPIFGVDSNLCDPKDPRFIFTKTSRRMMLDLYNNEIKLEEEFENIIIYGHSFSENDYSYFFPLFDKIRISDMTSTGKIVFAYSIYDKNKINEILQEQRSAITKLFYAYAKYKGISEEYRLLDSITTLDRVILYEIN